MEPHKKLNLLSIVQSINKSDWMSLEKMLNDTDTFIVFGNEFSKKDYLIQMQGFNKVFGNKFNILNNSIKANESATILSREEIFTIYSDKKKIKGEIIRRRLGNIVFDNWYVYMNFNSIEKPIMV
jgi:hypothetical protein